MAKHAVKKPKVTIANGHSIIRYLQSQRGGVIYAGADWNGVWGPRQQLMAKRRNYLMEVYSDVSYASAPDGNQQVEWPCMWLERSLHG